MDDRGVSQTLAVALLLAVTVVLGGATFAIVQPFAKEPPESQFTAVQLVADEAADTVWLRNLAGGELKGDFARIVITIDGVSNNHILEDFPEVQGGDWGPGEDLCIVGPGCLYENGVHVEVMVSEGTSLLARREVYVSSFFIDGDGGIGVYCSGDVILDVVGVEITYGAGGPDIPVTVDFTKDGGVSFEALYGGQAVVEDMTEDHFVEAGSLLGVRGTADGYGFLESYVSYDDDPHVAVLVHDDWPPDVPAFDDQASIADFLGPYVQPDGRIELASNQVIVLYEFNPDLTSSAADYQDLVVLFTFPNNGCSVTS